MKEKVVAIVLGNRLNDDGTITVIQEERLQLALEIEKKFNPDYYILSGGLANPNANITEAEAMYNYLINKGIAKEKLIMEKQSLTTVENAFYSIPIVKKLNANTLIICSSPYHFLKKESKLMESFINELQNTGISLMIYTKKLYNYE